jgi:hypothetical protein
MSRKKLSKNAIYDIYVEKKYRPIFPQKPLAVSAKQAEQLNNSSLLIPVAFAAEEGADGGGGRK